MPVVSLNIFFAIPTLMTVVNYQSAYWFKIVQALFKSASRLNETARNNFEQLLNCF